MTKQYLVFSIILFSLIFIGNDNLFARSTEASVMSPSSTADTVIRPKSAGDSTINKSPRPGITGDTARKKAKKPLVKSKSDEEDSDFVIKKPAYKYHINTALQKGEKFHFKRRAWLLSAVLPGAGQIYNKKYWKLPIVYGGFVGLGLIINFNQQNYDQTLQYYKILLVNPNSTSVPKEYQYPISSAQVASAKNYYRRNRDLAIIATAAIWVASIVDAFVDSELKGFDVSNKLSMHVSPWINTTSSFTSGFDRAIGAVPLGSIIPGRDVGNSFPLGNTNPGTSNSFPGTSSYFPGTSNSFAGLSSQIAYGLKLTFTINHL